MSADGVRTGSAISVERLYWVAPLTVAASVVAVWLLQTAAVRLFTPPSQYATAGRSLRQILALRGSLEPALITTVLVISAILVFVIVVREATDPVGTYRKIARAALLISLVPDVALALLSVFGWPIAVAYAAMHIAAWALTVALLTRLTPQSAL